jgi:hypothetical protein
MLLASKELNKGVTFLKMKELNKGESISENVGPKELNRGVNVLENVGPKELYRDVNCEHSSKCGTYKGVNILQMWDPNGT